MFEMLEVWNIETSKFETLKLKNFETKKLFDFQVRESPAPQETFSFSSRESSAPLNIPIPTLAPDQPPWHLRGVDKSKGTVHALFFVEPALSDLGL